MRQLSAPKAVSHAITSIWTYRQVALRVVLMWVPVMLALAIVEVWMGPPDPAATQITAQAAVQLLAGLVSFIAVCSVAVSWHRFILRDEVPGGLRLDASVLRYAGSTILIMLMMFIPALFLLAGTEFTPAAAAIAGLASLILVGGAVTRLSIKLPAVALGNHTFTFRDAWTVSEGNFWPCVGVFALTLVIAFGCVVLLLAVSGMAGLIDAMLAEVVLTVGAAVLQLFYAIFNAAMFTSLYGYFVEKRDF